jgi:sugar/nucleoside kinase (ribokinase family)
MASRAAASTRGKAAGTGARRGILCAGNFVIDYVALIDHYPAQDTLTNVLGTKLGNGGPAYNALVDLAHLGVPYPLLALGLVGDDPEGTHIVGHCKRLGIDTRLLRKVPGAQTSYSDIMTVASTGRRTIFHHRGANALLDRTHFDFGATRARVFHLAFLALLDRLDRPQKQHGTVAAEILASARRAGLVTAADVVSDASGRLPGLVAAALPHLDYFFLNETEVELVTGHKVRAGRGTLDPALLEAAGREVIARGLGGCLVLHTAEGAVALRRDQPARWQGSVRVPGKVIVGTNGAGDAFAAGFLHGVHEGLPVERCLHVATCVAASSLLDATPSDGVRSLAACLALGKKHGFRSIGR